ncbi:EthD family reductase [Enteractinococcus helveticum]|uniref:EthD domain-containing protein n=1 Tax=Enteractinococcus helveticum TaxID=1837282 RepID=A0A1B7M1K1_9MICC|nr:EthD family reductase [Enteractinococcus helveticum]OAV62435.1 hypothetical protein A6F49_06930 [Enteractinococcus helveticum]
MHDIYIFYRPPKDPSKFDYHYENIHVPLVQQLPELQNFTWGKVQGDDDAEYYLIACLTYENQTAAVQSLASEPGEASVQDLDNFAQAGVSVLHVPRLGGAQ